MPNDQTINSDLYIQTLQTLQKSFDESSASHKNFGEILEYDNARPQRSLKPHVAITKLG